MSVSLSLYKISDVLQVPLTYNNGSLSGGGVVSFPATEDFPALTIPVSPMMLSVGETVVAAFSTMGDLVIVVSHFPATGAVSMFLLNAAKLTVEGASVSAAEFFSKFVSLKEMVQTSRDAIVFSGYYSGHCWRAMKV